MLSLRLSIVMFTKNMQKNMNENSVKVSYVRKLFAADVGPLQKFPRHILTQVVVRLSVLCWHKESLFVAIFFSVFNLLVSNDQVIPSQHVLIYAFMNPEM